jgi:hypothetical protein
LSQREGQKLVNVEHFSIFFPGNTKGGSITVPLTSCLTGLEYSVLQIKTRIVSCHTADSKPVKQEVNGTVILPPLVFPVFSFHFSIVTARMLTPKNLKFKICFFKTFSCLT